MAKFLENLATATKAVLATTIIGMPALTTALLAAVAAMGIGVMPDIVEVQNALVNLLIALVGGLVVYQMPNSTKSDIVDQKLEDKKANQILEAVAEAEDEKITIVENPPV